MCTPVNSFFSAWNDAVSEQQRLSNVNCQKLEFYINIWFAIFPLTSAGHERGAEGNAEASAYGARWR